MKAKNASRVSVVMAFATQCREDNYPILNQNSAPHDSIQQVKKRNRKRGKK
jgi:hypothetical protein